MKIEIVRASDSKLVSAEILLWNSLKPRMILPSISDGWRFNFHKNTIKEGLETYILVCEHSPDTIEGCISLKIDKKRKRFQLSYIEVAPHNRTPPKVYERIAGCLIAYACRQSLRYDSNTKFKGWIELEVLEEDKEVEKKIMALYSRKYGALRLADTNSMFISPASGKELIIKYLNRNYDERD